MHRIDGATAALVLPTPPAGIGTPGFFTNGDPSTSTPATIVSYDWANAVQEELAHVITDPAGGNMALDKASNTQLLAAIGAIIDRRLAISDAIATLRVETLIITRGGGPPRGEHLRHGIPDLLRPRLRNAAGGLRHWSVLGLREVADGLHSGGIELGRGRLRLYRLRLLTRRAPHS